MFFFGGGDPKCNLHFLGGPGGTLKCNLDPWDVFRMDVFFGGGGGGKNETGDLAGGSLHFTTVYNFLQSQFCHVLLLLGGGDPKCNLHFLTLVGMVCYILKAWRLRSYSIHRWP